MPSASCRRHLHFGFALDGLLHRSYVTCNEEVTLASSVSQRVKKRRAALRAAGLRPVQIWVPDARRSDFAEECRRQSRIVAKADARDRSLAALLDATLGSAGA